MLKIRLLFFISLFSITLLGQENLNKYKYVLVPNQFEFQKNAGDYDLNRLTKFLFKKYGFNALLSNEVYPDDFAQNRCLGLTAQLRKQSSFLKSKIKVELVNCYNQVVFTSNEASSKEKDYKKAYHEATRKAFESFNGLNYIYKPEESNNEVVSSTEVKNETNNKVDVIKKEIKKTEEIIVNSTVNKNQTKEVESLDLLYAQPIQNGFQLVNSTPKIVYIIQKTSVQNVYVLKDMNGILYKDNDTWFVEYYYENQLIKKELDIKF